MSRKYLRGEIYYADLDPVVGSEQMGTRPVLILQNNVGNHFARTVIVAPITSRIHTKSKIPTHSNIGMIGRMKYPSVVMLEQLRTLDKRRIGYYIGKLPEEKMQDVTRALCVSLAIRQNTAKGWTDLLCAVCTKRLRFLYQCRLTGVCRQVYTQGKAHGKEKRLPKCAEG